MIDWRFKINSETDIQKLYNILNIVGARIKTLQAIHRVPKAEILPDGPKIEIVEAK